VSLDGKQKNNSMIISIEIFEKNLMKKDE